MEDLSEKFNSLPETEFPPALHGQIMNRAVLLRFRKMFFAVWSVLLLNFAVAGYFLFTRMVDNDAFTFINFMVKEFELSSGYFVQFLSVLYDNIPIRWLFVAFLDIILIVYIMRFRFSFKNAGRAFLKQELINY